MFDSGFNYYSGFPGADRTLPAELGLFVMAAIVIGIAFTLAAGRSAADPRELRPVARYLGAISLLTLFVTLFASFAAVHALTDLVVDHRDRRDDVRRELRSSSYSVFPTDELYLPVADTIFVFSGERDNNANYAVAVTSGLIAITTGAVLAVHLRWRRRLAGEPVMRAVSKVMRLTICFVTALVAAIALTSVGFAVFELIAPQTAVGGTKSVVRAEGASELVSFGLLGTVSVLLFRRAQKPFRFVAPVSPPKDAAP